MSLEFGSYIKLYQAVYGLGCSVDQHLYVSIMWNKMN